MTTARYCRSRRTADSRYGLRDPDAAGVAWDGAWQAFKNDISFWSSLESTKGISVRSVAVQTAMVAPPPPRPHPCRGHAVPQAAAAAGLGEASGSLRLTLATAESCGDVGGAAMDKDALDLVVEEAFEHIMRDLLLLQGVAV